MTRLDLKGLELPPIPSKRYFTSGEVSALCKIKPHVLRYWEQEFPQLKPVKRRGNRRYYQRHEVKLIRHIRYLLYVESYTISGARVRLEEMGAKGAETVSSIEQDKRDKVEENAIPLKITLDPNNVSERRMAQLIDLLSSHVGLELEIVNSTPFHPPPARQLKRSG